MNKYSEKEYEIFSRLFILKEFSEENIKKLCEINIGIVGIGGIGCPLSQYLVSSGIKKLTLVDGDSVEKNNLNRQILFGVNDIGKKKVKVARKKLQLINSDCNIDIIDNNIDNKNINALSKCSIIVDAADDWKTSKFLNEYCLKNSITRNRGKNESMVNDTCNACGLGCICFADHNQTRRIDKDGV